MTKEKKTKIPKKGVFVRVFNCPYCKGKIQQELKSDEPYEICCDKCEKYFYIKTTKGEFVYIMKKGNPEESMMREEE